MPEREVTNPAEPVFLELFQPTGLGRTHLYLPEFVADGSGGMLTLGSSYSIERETMEAAFRGDYNRECHGEGLILPGHDSKVRPVVIKMMQSMEEAEDVLRFMEVTNALKRVDHPHLAKVLDATFLPSPDGRVYPTLIMPRYYGMSADRILGKGYIDPSAMAEVIVQIGDGLDALARANVVHGDVKPGNIYMEKGARARGNTPDAKLIDYGSSHIVGKHPHIPRGTVWHTPGFTAPEVTTEQPPTGKSDQFGLAKSAELFLENTNLCPLTELSGLRIRSSLPDPIQEVLARGMAPNPEARYGSSLEFAEELRAVVERFTP